jgi:hypothetical protein
MTVEQMNLPIGKALAVQGIELAAKNRDGAIAVARDIAVKHILKYGEVSADDVYKKYMETHDEWLGNAAGKIFHYKYFEWTGKMVPSQRPSRHGNLVRVWTIKDTWMRVLKP